MFDSHFVWGAAASSYQIEGAVKEGGKGETIWDVYSHQSGRIANGEHADTTCDHYHRMKEDVELMAEMGLKAYRFSVDWARIMPAGTGEINEEGIAFYSDLVDALLEKHIEPYMTLYHWDLPMELHRKGGWLNRDIVEWFGDYAAVMSERFSGRVKNFFTINEPQCFIGLGYGIGIHAPGWKCSTADTVLMAHHALMAHGRAVQQLRAHAKAPIRVGFAPTSGGFYPETETEDNIRAAREMYFSIPKDEERWFWNVSWFSDPVFLGTYPEEGLSRFRCYLPDTLEEDLKLISQPVDFCGQNLYNGQCVRAGQDGRPEVVSRYMGFPRTASDWPVTPEALRWVVRFLYERYQKPVIITENGISCCDVVSLDGEVHDPQRIDFVHRYLLELHKAVDDGAEAAGYFYWSLLDNYEWNDGFKQRFGMVYVDYRDGRRIIKDSGKWYKEVIRTNGDILKLPD